MIRRYYTLLNIIGLLLLLPQAMLGQTHLSKTPDSRQRPALKAYETKGWWHELLHGGMIRTRSADGRRTGDRYLIIHPGGSSAVRMDFVNGFTVGPDLTLGKMFDNYSRLEADVAAEWACSRKRLMWDLGLRYILPQEYHASVGVFATRHTRDFDGSPMMNKGQKGAASGLFGWNGYKLYEAESYGLKAATLLHDDLQLETSVWHEEREAMVNHRRNNLFGMKPKPNLLDMRGQGTVRYDASEDRLWRADLTLRYQPGSRLYIYDDMHSDWRNQGPQVSLNLQSGWGNAGLRFASVELSIGQQVGEAESKDRFSYKVSGGFFPTSHCVELPDWHHFDATHFCWQNRMENSLTWFSLLTNYELSTRSRWAELHAEYMHRSNSFFAQYMQLHLLSVPNHRAHSECSYGWQLSKEIRLGLSAGFDGTEYDGLGLNLIIVVDDK